MAIDKSRILTISAREYCEIYDKKLSDYTAVGVHYEGAVTSGLLSMFSNSVPNEAEVVVGYTPLPIFQSKAGDAKSSGLAAGIASGTALIPRKKEKDITGKF